MMEVDNRLISVDLKNEDGDQLGSSFEVPLTINAKQLQLLCNQLMNSDEAVPCSFFVNSDEIRDKLSDVLNTDKMSMEHVISIVYQPQALFRVFPVTRCTSSIPGHGEAVTCVSSSPDGRYLASGSGDSTVRFWDVSTETPQFTCKGHKHWVLFVAWSPDGRKLASGCKNGSVMLWNPETGQQIGRTLLRHKKWITCLSWEPLHMNEDCRFLASSSKDTDICLWDTILGQCTRTLSGHTNGVSWIRWGGEGLLFSASQDRTMRVWRTNDGAVCRTLQGHGHWINTMALSTDYVMRTGAFDPSQAQIVYRQVTETPTELRQLAKKRYDAVKGSQPERLVSGSDDFTLFLWTPSTDKKPIARMTGHHQLVNQVSFSPDGRLIASASFDKSIKLWDGISGKFLSTLRGHVQAVYQVAWAADSRLLVSGSADSTLKVWNVKTRSLEVDLPGHADEIYGVDWSPDGQRVVSGGKDKVIRIWRR